MKRRSPGLYKYAACFLTALLLIHTTSPLTTVLAATGATVSSASAKEMDTYTVGNLIIEIERVAVPVSSGTLSYTGKELKGAELPALDSDYKLSSGTVSAIKPGEYNFTLELIDPLSEDVLKKITEKSNAAESAKDTAATPGQYVPATPSQYTAVRYRTWNDGSAAPRTLKWSVAALKTTIPTGKTLTYTGKEQTGVDPSADNSYTVTGSKATKVGEYKALANLTEGHIWADGTSGNKEISWSIKRASSGSSSDGSGGSGGSSGTGVSAVKVVRPDGTTSVYGRTGSAGSYTQGGSVISPSASAQTADTNAPSGAGLVQAGPSQSPSQASSSAAVPAQSKLPQSTAVKETAAASKPASPVSSVKPSQTAAAKKETTEKAMASEDPTVPAVEPETTAVETDDESSVTFEFLSADNAVSEPLPAVQPVEDGWNPQALAGVLIKALLLLAGLGATGAFVWLFMKRRSGRQD